MWFASVMIDGSFFGSSCSDTLWVTCWILHGTIYKRYKNRTSVKWGILGFFCCLFQLFLGGVSYIWVCLDLYWLQECCGVSHLSSIVSRQSKNRRQSHSYTINFCPVSCGCNEYAFLFLFFLFFLCAFPSSFPCLSPPSFSSSSFSSLTFPFMLVSHSFWHRTSRGGVIYCSVCFSMFWFIPYFLRWRGQFLRVGVCIIFIIAPHRCHFLPFSLLLSLLFVSISPPSSICHRCRLCSSLSLT